MGVYLLFVLIEVENTGGLSLSSYLCSLGMLKVDLGKGWMDFSNS